jgi:copper oxidase (laccase) domain-containing protein
MPSVFVAISTVEDGNMYIPGDFENQEVIEHRKTWLQKQGIAISDTSRVYITYDQDDFCQYRNVDGAHKQEGMMDGYVARADALATTTPGRALFLPVADCVATTLFDEEHGVLMLSHLGRHSIEQEGGVKSITYLLENYGVKPENLKVWLGPAPNNQTYPLFKLNGQGMKEAVSAQLEKAGVQRQNVIDIADDTTTDDRYYSHSEFLKGNKAEDGRFAMVAVMKS